MASLDRTSDPSLAKRPVSDEQLLGIEASYLVVLSEAASSYASRGRPYIVMTPTGPPTGPYLTLAINYGCVSGWLGDHTFGLRPRPC